MVPDAVASRWRSGQDAGGGVERDTGGEGTDGGVGGGWVAARGRHRDAGDGRPDDTGDDVSGVVGEGRRLRRGRGPRRLEDPAVAGPQVIEQRLSVGRQVETRESAAAQYELRRSRKADLAIFKRLKVDREIGPVSACIEVDADVERGRAVVIVQGQLGSYQPSKTTDYGIGGTKPQLAVKRRICAATIRVHVWVRAGRAWGTRHKKGLRIDIQAGIVGVRKHQQGGCRDRSVGGRPIIRALRVRRADRDGAATGRLGRACRTGRGSRCRSAETGRKRTDYRVGRSRGSARRRYRDVGDGRTDHPSLSVAVVGKDRGGRHAPKSRYPGRRIFRAFRPLPTRLEPWASMTSALLDGAQKYGTDMSAPASRKIQDCDPTVSRTPPLSSNASVRSPLSMDRRTTPEL